MVALQHWFTLLISHWLISLPWLMVGVVISTGLFIFAPRDRWDHWLPSNPWWQILWGWGLGFLLPIGQAGIFPVIRRLMWQSGSSSLAIACWLSAISLNPILLLQLWRAFPDNGEILLFVMGLGFGILVLLSLIFSTQNQLITQEQADDSVFKYPAIARPSLHRIAIAPIATDTLSSAKISILPVSRKSRISLGFFCATRELLEWSLWLLMGCAIAASLQMWVMPRLVTSVSPWATLISGMASPQSFRQHFTLAGQWLQLGNAGHSLGFLLGSMFINCTSICLMINTFRLKAFAYLLCLLSLLAIALTLWLNFYVF